MAKRQTTLDRPISKVQRTSALGKWLKVGGCLIFKHNQQVDSEKIASFDFDSTLTVTKSGKQFPTGPLDWQLWHTSVDQKLKSLLEEGYKLVIFTNQNGIAKGKITEDFIKDRFEGFLTSVNLPIDIYISIAEDHFRKPNTGMWKQLLRNLPSPDVDKEASFFCGDAAGRPKGWKSGLKKDFSCTDRKFALNIGIKFVTPEELFLNESPHAVFSFNSLTPDELRARFEGKTLDTSKLTSPTQEMVLLVAFPASGKTTFCKRYMIPKGYVHVNRDTLKTKEKCMKVAEDALKEGKSVVIDNTNPDIESRKVFINIAKKHNVPVRCFYFHDIDLDLSHHLNMYREKITEGVSKHVPRVGIYGYRKKFSEPKLTEGFSEILKIDFVPEFDNDEMKEEFFMHIHEL